jgi:hypothetical protein
MRSEYELEFQFRIFVLQGGGHHCEEGKGSAQYIYSEDESVKSHDAGLGWPLTHIATHTTATPIIQSNATDDCTPYVCLSVCPAPECCIKEVLCQYGEIISTPQSWFPTSTVLLGHMQVVN